MKKIITTLVAGLIIGTFSLLSFEEKAEAEQLTTDFAFTMTIGSTTNSLAAPTPPGKVLILPSILNNWECSVTPPFISNDGSQKYHNIVCTDLQSSSTLGMSIICDRRKVDTDHKSFFLRKNGADVSFEGQCLTHSVSAKPSSTPNTSL